MEESVKIPVKHLGVISLVWLILSLLTAVEPLSAQPAVVTQPRDTSVCVETTVQFGIVAVNTTAYQWQEFDGIGWYNLDGTFTYIQGQNTPTLTIIDANLALNSYEYRCVVSDINSLKDTSSSAQLGVYDPPIITQNPANDRVCKNEIGLFSVAALNGTAYRWQEFNSAGWLNLENNAFYSGVRTPDLSVYTVLGMNNNKYRCIVTNVSCPDTSLTATLTVDPTPVAFNMTGGGYYCEGGEGVLVGLSGSETSTVYNLLLDGNETGVVRVGNGGAINFGLQAQSGIYTVRAFNEFTPCSALMNGLAAVGINPLPDLLSLQGGGSVCAGEPGPEVYLMSSEEGVSYSLYRNGQPTGIIIAGNGFALSFGNQDTQGLYTVLATHTSTGCQQQMEGAAQVIVNELPLVDAGPDQTIEQGNSVVLTGMVSPSAGNYAYHWMPQSLCVNPQQAVTSTHQLFLSSLFTFQVTNMTTGCHSLPDTTIVLVTDGPLNVQLFQSASAVCSGESVQLSAIPGGGTGNYSYAWTSSPPGFTSTVANPVVFPTESAVYHLVLSDGAQTVMKSVSVEVFDLPQSFTLSNGGSYCNGGEGVEITLSDSEYNTYYRLFYDQVEVAVHTGTGQSFSFGTFTNPGVYHAVAGNNNGCERQQSGQAVIIVNDNPVADAGTNQVITAGQATSLQGAGSGGLSPYNYSWSPVDLMVNPSSSTPATLPLSQTQLFTLHVSDAATCVSEPDEVVVLVVGGEPELRVLTSTFPRCPGESVTLYAIASGGTGNWNYFWQSDPAGFSSTLFNPVVNPEVTTTYTVTASDGMSVLSSSVTVDVLLSPEVYSVGGGGQFCLGENPESITLSGSETNTQYRLLRDGQNTAVLKNGTGYALVFGNQSIPGSYTVVATRTATQCYAPMEGDAIVVQLPTPQVDAGPDQLISAGSSTNLSAVVTGGSGSYSYNWQPSSLCISPVSQNTSTIPLSQSTMFTLQVSDQNSQCLAEKDTVFVLVQGGQQLSVRASAVPGLICLGTEVSLSALASGGTGNYAYEWSSNPVGFLSSAAQVAAYPQVSTSFFVRVFDGNTYAFDTVVVQVNTPPAAFNVTGGGGYCIGQQGVAVGLSGSQPDYSYTLLLNGETPLATFSGTGLPLDFGWQSEIGIYSVLAENPSGCSAMMNGQVTVEINSPPLSNAGSDVVIARGETALLHGSATQGSGSYLYSWIPSDSIQNPASATAETTPLHTSAIFSLVVTDSQTGCFSEPDEMMVTVIGGALHLSVVADATMICSGSETRLYALVSGGSGNYTYTWSSNPAGFSSALIAPSVSPSQTTVYEVVVTDGEQSLSGQITIEVQSPPVVFNLTGGGAFCEEDSPESITLSGSQVNHTYELLRNGVSTGISKPGNGFPLQFGVITNSGAYTAIALQNQYQCSAQMAGQATVVKHPRPVANAGPDKIVPENSSALLTGSVENGSGSAFQYLWQPYVLCVSPQSATTSTVSLNQSTLFQFKATDLVTGCVSLPDTAFVFTVGSDLYARAEASLLSVCFGDPVNLTAMAGGGTGNYSWAWSSLPPSTLSISQTLTVFPLENTVYYLEVFDGENYAYDSVEILVGNSPASFNLLGGGGYCPESAGVSISLSGSESGVEYTLFLSPGQEMATLTGTGNQLEFGFYTSPGSYFAVAGNNSQCSRAMNGEVSVVAFVSPVAVAGSDLTIPFGSAVLLRGSAVGGSGFYTFDWSPSDSLVNPANAEALTLPLHATTLFSLSVEDAITGCMGTTDEAVVFVSGGVLSVDVVADHHQICSGEQVQLYALPTGGTGNYDYLWTSQPSGFVSQIYNPVVTPITNTWYYAFVEDDLSSAVDSILISVSPSPVVFTLEGAGFACEGSDIDNIILAGSESETNYSLWNSEQGLLETITGYGSPLDFGSPQQSGYYYVLAQHSISGCSSAMSDTLVAGYIALPLADAGSDQFIQMGTSATLFGTASGGSGEYAYLWSPDYLLNNPILPQPSTVDLDLTSLFYLNTSDIQSGCTSNTDNTTVFVIGGPLSLVASASPSITCSGEPVVLEALPSGGSGNYTYLWTSSPSGLLSNSANPVVYPTLSSSYFVEASDGVSIVYDTVFVEVNNQPEVFVLTGGGGFCPGEEGVLVQLSGSEQAVYYTLYCNADPVAQVTGTGSPVSFGRFTLPGTYRAEAAFFASSCKAQMAGSAVVTAYDRPVADAGSDRYISSGEYAVLQGSASGGSGVYGYSWNPTEFLLNPNDPDPVTVALNATRMFTLEVEDANTGCKSLASNAFVFVVGGVLSVDIIAPVQSVCPGGQLSLFALPAGGSGLYQYYWESDPSGFFATGGEVVVTPTTATWYRVTVVDGQQQAVDSVYIEPLPTPSKFNLLGGGAYCPYDDGVTITLENSQPATSYDLLFQNQSTGVYQTGTGGALNFGQFLASGVYSVVATNATGCEAEMLNPVQVSVSPLPTAYQVIGGGTYCSNDTTLGLLLESSQLHTTYELLVDAQLTGIQKTGTGLPLSFPGLMQSGIYSVHAVNDQTGCSNTMSGAVPFIIHQAPQVVITGDTSICLGDSAVLTGSGAFTYEWNTVPVQYSPGIKVSPEFSTNYVLVGYNNNGCYNMATHHVSVYERPQLMLQNDPYQLVVTADPPGLEDYTFSISDKVVQQGSANRWSYAAYNGKSDTLFVIAVSDHQCGAEANLYLSLEEPPNAFTPNGDGVNDLFLPGVEITVFSSWGGELYHGSEGWDGKHSGALVVPGTYYYIRPLYDGNGVLMSTYKGSVTVVIE